MHDEKEEVVERELTKECCQKRLPVDKEVSS